MHHHSHAHGHSHVPKKERTIAIAAALTGGFMLAELVGGILSGSLALLADAGHMLTDFASLMLAWFAFRIARRPADWKRTYGYDRFSVLAAFVNGLTLFAIAIWIVIEAIRRLSQPVEVLGGLMLWVALAGLVVNIASFWVLTREDSDNLNIRAAALHVAGDLLGSVAAIVASLVILWTGWMPIDDFLHEPNLDPFLKPAVAGLVRRELRGHLAPLRTRPQDPHHPIQDLSCVAKGTASSSAFELIFWKQGFHKLPLLVSKSHRGRKAKILVHVDPHPDFFIIFECLRGPMVYEIGSSTT